ncbi:MerR family transcriptional regulator [Streptomyces sp. NRRL S-87]|uniref:MerR family transcriptional regulator n=1 Tax=Streptomyces sp. NRRL S-87 TaxID=1463920 RepID=UPI0004C1716F|nr:MerR family transcriptional regulator [Streptomyces sp. NRRL S-87]
MADSAYGTTTGAVARLLGVSPTTLRSWERRYGIGPAAERQEGRHRRWTPRDIAELEEMCRLTASGVPPAEAARAALDGRSARGTGAGDLGGAGDAGVGGTGDAGVGGAGHADVGGAGDPAGPGGVRRTGDAPGTGAGSKGPGGAAGGAVPRDVRQERRGLARAAVRLDAPALDALLHGAVARHGLVTAWEEVMAPTLHAVGRKWETAGDRYVEVEHLLSWHVSTALRRAASLPRPVARAGEDGGGGPAGRGPWPGAGHEYGGGGGRAARAAPVLLACVPSEQHTLALEALAAGLAERGLPTRMFGAGVPAEALDAAVRRTGPAAVVLWSQARSTASRALARSVAAGGFGVRGARTRPAVLLAGPGWAGRTPDPGMARPASLGEALDVLGRLYPPGGPSGAVP